MHNFEYIKGTSDEILGIALLDTYTEDFDDHLDFLRELHGDLERHHKDNEIWVTRHKDDERVMSLDLIENELEIYFI